MGSDVDGEAVPRLHKEGIEEMPRRAAFSKLVVPVSVHIVATHGEELVVGGAGGIWCELFPISIALTCEGYAAYLLPETLDVSDGTGSTWTEPLIVFIVEAIVRLLEVLRFVSTFFTESVRWM